MKVEMTKYIWALGLTMVLATSCTKELDREPYYGLNAANVYTSEANYYHVLAKCYAGFALTGNQGPAGAPDITGFDEGSSGFLRTLWNLQTLTTDEAVCGWNDPGIPELHGMSWSSENVWTKFMYYRIYYEIPLCNEFIRESADAKLDERGFSAEDKKKIQLYRDEARFLRALSYYHAMDLFGNVPFVTEEDGIGATLPERITRADLFKYIESELLAIESTLNEPRSGPYGRADKSAVRALLAKMYLNAEVYLGAGNKKYNECVANCTKIIGSGYSLDPTYRYLFQTRNNLSPEMIFPIVYDGRYTQTYGGTTYLTHAAVGGQMNKNEFGINSGWAGLRTTSAFVNQFTDTIDGRYLFFKKGQNLEITSIGTFTDGYAIAKWKNMAYDTIPGTDVSGNFVDTDWPIFRLADVYLMYAEATLRGGNGNASQALSYVNSLRERAYGNSNNNLTSISLPIILNERAKELYWEGSRRTDLIRFGLFTSGAYLWPWKGGAKDGVAVSDHLNLFPIPASDLSANPNLIQNPGY